MDARQVLHHRATSLVQPYLKWHCIHKDLCIISIVSWMEHSNVITSWRNCLPQASKFCPVFAHLKHMINRKKVLGRDRELYVFHFLFLFLFLIAQSLISPGLCWFAHWRFMCKYACGMCARLGLLITKCAFLVFKYTQSTSTHDYGLTICLFSRIGLIFPWLILKPIKFSSPHPHTHTKKIANPTTDQWACLLLQQGALQAGCWSEGPY